MGHHHWVIRAAICVVLAISSEALADDQTYSPFFVMDGASPATLVLQETRADVQVAGVMAEVVVTQTYENQGQATLSAHYVFPASTRAAVHGMRMTIGERTIQAQIRERDAARSEYEAAERQGKTASLLEQERPNVFSMRVANILPGDRVRVELRYTELLVATDGVYELVYPTVVGPRYASSEANDSNASIDAPREQAGASPFYDLELNVLIAAGMPIYELASPSHRIETTQRKDHSTAVRLRDLDGGNRDFILQYRLAGQDLASGLLLYEGAEENYFFMMVQPPQRPPAEAVPPREYVFIVDVSGSMDGFPREVSATLMRELLATLRPGERFNVVLFAGASAVYAEQPVEANAGNVEGALTFLQAAPAGGGTELLPALEAALRMSSSSGRARSFVVITDGFITAERPAFELVRQHLGEANLFAFGIGSSVNRFLIEGLAKAGLGAPFVVTEASEAPRVAAAFRSYIAAPVLTDVSVDYGDFQVYELQPAAIPDVFASRPVLVFGKWRGAARGTIELTGISGRGRFSNRFDVAAVRPSLKHRALEYLWARTRIADLSELGEPNAAEEAEIRSLGLRHGLLTRFTSFIAVDQRARATGESVAAAVPLPLPEGMTDAALGVVAGPEPSLVWLFIAAGAALLVAQRRRFGGAR